MSISELGAWAAAGAVRGPVGGEPYLKHLDGSLERNG